MAEWNISFRKRVSNHAELKTKEPSRGYPPVSGGISSSYPMEYQADTRWRSDYPPDIRWDICCISDGGFIIGFKKVWGYV